MARGEDAIKGLRPHICSPLGKIRKNIRKIYGFFFGPFLADFGQNWSKIASPGPGRASKGFLDALGFILAKYQPKRSHGDPFQLHFDYFLTFFDDYFFENQLFLKKSISRGSSGQSAKLKMTAYRSSNSEVLTYFLTILMHFYIKSLPIF